MSGEAGEDPGAVAPPTARTLTVISFAMGGGLAMLAGFIFLSYLGGAAKVPAPRDVKFINTATTVAMVAALLAIIASEIAWRSLLRKSPGPLSGRVHIAFIVRLACREGAGLLGLTIAYLAALNGVLRIYPAYWVNLAPFALFLVFLATHWPSAERLSSEARDILGSGH